MHVLPHVAAFLQQVEPIQVEAKGFLERLAERGHAFGSLLVHDSRSTTDERMRLVPILLGAWLLANIVVSPLAWVLLRALRGVAELRKVITVNAGIGLLQVIYFAIDWYVIAWGFRKTDWAVAGMALIATALAAKWGYGRPLIACVVYAIGQAILSLGLIFLIVFTLAEMGKLKL